MRRLLLAASSLTAVSLLIGGTSDVMSDQTLEITGYRIQSDDCPAYGCGLPSFGSEAEFSAFLKSRTAAATANGTGTATAVSAVCLAAGEEGEEEEEVEEEDLTSDQVVFLDFDAGGAPTFPVFFTTGQLFGIFADHIYTPAERDEIQRRIEADYAEFDYVFTQEQPTGCDFSTLSFGQNDNGNISLTPFGGLSILFGRADNIDFRNQSKVDNAFIDASFWEFLAQLDPSGGLFSSFSGIPVTTTLEAAVSEAVVNQSSNTGAHELGHIQGLRHHDSFGAPGDGLPSSGRPSPNDFIPVFTGPQNASETPNHVMASGASVGLTLSGSTISDRYFSERSAVKFAATANARIDVESKVTGGNKKVKLRNVRLPNTILNGVNTGAVLKGTAAVVQGNISASGEVDTYRFKAKAGEFANIEMVSFTDDRFTNPVIGAMKLYYETDTGSRILIAENIQTFEPFDPLIFDAPLPQTGTYALEVDAPNFVFFDYTGDGIPDPFPLDQTGNGGLRVGDYELLFYKVNKKLSDDADEAEEAEEEAENEAADD